jgi:peptide/nickel transport system permease protein
VGAYVIRRILIAIPVLLGITILGFTALSLAPGDPLLARMDPAQLAQLQQHPDELDKRRHELGLDQPIPVRYVVWLQGAITGDFGYSIQSHRPIAEEIGKRIPVTLALMGAAILLALIVGIPFGILSSLRQYSGLDYGLTTITMLASSTPTFVLGLGGIYLFAVWLHWLPSGGVETLGRPSGPADFLWHLILPAAVLGLASAAPLLRYTRASMLEVLGSEYVTTARAKGLASRRVIIGHAFRNSLIPIVTVIGLLLPELVAGAVITEQIFAWPGMGQLAVRAARDRDAALMMGVVLVVGIAVLVTNIVVDVVYARIDPRIRLGSSSN